ncbi:unnamed protein product, partial [Effrenium voratum]
EQLGYTQGIDFEVAAFQAVNAADIRGRTLHNACGLGVDAAALDRAVGQEAAKRMSYWRWLVVDEVSMAGLACAPPLCSRDRQVEQRLRAVVPSASQWKRNAAGDSRAFAGVNVLLLGDFYQLPPPSGGYLADVPSSRRPPRLSAAADAEPDLLADYGRELVWGGALQGVTELEERERCKDAWWNEVVDELRRGKLSEENWRYLHGKPVEGCRLTAAERDSRRRVVAGPGDPRLSEEKFRWAAAIVANNDAKYQINKDRAEDYSRAAESPLRWSVALDAPSAEVLQTQECDKTAKAPSAACEKCKDVKTLDYFSDRQWERVRANRSAICLACGPSKGGQKALKRKLPSGLARLDCRGCKFRKLEDAFPRAQLHQGDSEAARRCLKCLKEVCALECSVCLAEKPISEFTSAAATMPWAAVCAACGAEAKKRRRPERAGWFACRTCETFFPPQGAAKTEASGQSQRCLNCASRGSWAKGKSTCRKCGAVWNEPRGQSDKRQRLCPKCRPGSARRL